MHPNKKMSEGYNQYRKPTYSTALQFLEGLEKKNERRSFGKAV